MFQEIDLTLDKVKTQGYSALVNVGQQGLNFAVQSALTVSSESLSRFHSYYVNMLKGRVR